MQVKDKTSFVSTREDLAVFVHELAHDLRTKPQEWKNATLVDYLDAMAAWIEDCEGLLPQLRPASSKQPNWQTLAKILLASKHYE